MSFKTALSLSSEQCSIGIFSTAGIVFHTLVSHCQTNDNIALTGCFGSAHPRTQGLEVTLWGKILEIGADDCDSLQV